MESTTNEGQKSSKGSKAPPRVTRDVLCVAFGQIEADEATNCRTEYRDIDDLALSIRTDGLITPLTVIRREGTGDNGDAIYDLNSGFRRYKALKLIKTSKTTLIPVVVRSMPEGEGAVGDLLIANLTENTARDEVHPADLAVALKRLEEEHGKTRKEIAEKTTLSGSYIGNLIRAVNQLSPEVLKTWRKKDLPMQVINAVSKLSHEKQEEQVGEFLALREQQEQFGRKNKKRKKDEDEDEDGGGSGGGEEREAGASDDGSVWRPRKEILTMMEEIRGKIDEAGARDAELYKQQLKALRWVSGEIGSLRL